MPEPRYIWRVYGPLRHDPDEAARLALALTLDGPWYVDIAALWNLTIEDFDALN